LEQAPEPAVAEKVPGAQIVQVAAAAVVDPSGPAKPAAHLVPRQLVTLVFGAN